MLARLSFSRPILNHYGPFCPSYKMTHMLRSFLYPFEPSKIVPVPFNLPLHLFPKSVYSCSIRLLYFFHTVSVYFCIFFIPSQSISVLFTPFQCIPILRPCQPIFLFLLPYSCTFCPYQSTVLFYLLSHLSLFLQLLSHICLFLYLLSYLSLFLHLLSHLSLFLCLLFHLSLFLQLLSHLCLFLYLLSYLSLFLHLLSHLSLFLYFWPISVYSLTFCPISVYSYTFCPI
jgi:hypothetical protein